MKIIDTYSLLLDAFEDKTFQFDKWEKYINSVYPNVASIFISDMKKCIATGEVSWENDYLPVLNMVVHNDELRNLAHESFCRATEGLEQKINKTFGKSLDADIVLYLGLCNGAGWVKQYNGRTIVFLGIEKIMELNWCSIDDMYGLIYHELGHVYHKQYGILERKFENDTQTFLWQLFKEGIAMYFEQILVGDPDYYHEDKHGWKVWCDEHFRDIKQDFTCDLKTMTFATQRYFGDWVSYHGHSDVGYYLGCRFVHFILSMYEFDDIINFDIDMVAKLYEEFANL